MNIPDESALVEALAISAFDPQATGLSDRDKRAALEQLREFCYQSVDDAQAAVWNTGDANAAIPAAVRTYQKQREKRIAYRRKVEGQ